MSEYIDKISNRKDIIDYEDTEKIVKKPGKPKHPYKQKVYTIPEEKMEKEIRRSASEDGKEKKLTVN